MECDTAVQIALNAVATPVLIVNLASDTITFANDAAHTLFVDATAVSKLVAPDDRERWQVWCKQPATAPLDACWQTADGGSAHWRCAARRYTPDASVYMLTLTPLDAENTLRERADFLENLVNTLPDEVYVKDKDCRFVFLNQSALRGFSDVDVNTILGKNDLELFGEYARHFYDAEQQLLATGEPIINDDFAVINTRYASPNRRLIINKVPLYDANQTIIGLVGINRDMTTWERALRESEARYRAISEITSDYMFSVVIPREGEYIYEWITDSAYERITGYRFDEIRNQIGTGILYHPDDWELVQTDLARMLRGRHSIANDYRIIRKDGIERWLHVQRDPVWDATEGRVVRYYGAARDITEQKQVEFALRESEQRYRIISEMISDYTFAVRIEPDGTRITEWITEASFERITGYNYRDVLPQLMRGILFHADDWERAQADTERMITSGQPNGAEYRTLRRDGTLRWVHIQRIPIRDKDGRISRYYAATRDITPQKQAEIALRESEQRYRIISEIVSDYAFAFVLGPDGQLHGEWMLEDALTRMTGYTSQEIRERGDQALYHPDDQERVRLDLEMTLKGIVTTSEYRILTKLGEERWVRMYRQPRWNDDQTQVIGFYAVTQDITDYKRAEEIALQETQLRSLLQHEKDLSQTKSKIMTLIAHEFRTPLTIISTSAQVLERYQARLSPEKQLHHLHQVQRQVVHLTELLEDVALVIQGQMRQFTPRWERLDMVAVCRDMLDQFMLNIGADHRLVFDMAGDPQSLTADRRLIQYILRNLLSNAIKYSQMGSEIRLELIFEAEACLLRVQDHGMGISLEDQPHIFTPFYRSQKTGDISGLGLGLSVVKDAVELHRGLVTVDSQPGIGTTFKIRLPLEAPTLV